MRANNPVEKGGVGKTFMVEPTVGKSSFPAMDISDGVVIPDSVSEK